MNFNDTAIISVRENDYGIHFCYIKKDEAINIMKFWLKRKTWIFIKIQKIKLFFIYAWKMNNNNTFYKRNREILLKQAKDLYQKGGKEKAKQYYENNKEILQ